MKTVRIHWRVIAASTAAGALAVAGIWLAGGKANAEPTVADQVCTLFEEHGVSQKTAAELIYAISNALAVTPEQAAQVINVSVQTDCPQYWTTLVAVGDEFRAQESTAPAPPPERPRMTYAV